MLRQFKRRFYLWKWTRALGRGCNDDLPDTPEADEIRHWSARAREALERGDIENARDNLALVVTRLERMDPTLRQRFPNRAEVVRPGMEQVAKHHRFVCMRCHRTVELAAGPPPLFPDGWEGTPNEAVCPGCQYAEWHPHCTSLVTLMEGERVDPMVDWAGIPREEWDLGSLTRCEYIDMTVSWIDDADWPDEWTCPECGGTKFEGVHRDYLPSGLQNAGFAIEASEVDEGGDEAS